MGLYSLLILLLVLIEIKKNVKTLADVSVLGMSIIIHVLAPACRQCFLTNKELGSPFSIKLL